MPIAFTKPVLGAIRLSQHRHSRWWAGFVRSHGRHPWRPPLLYHQFSTTAAANIRLINANTFELTEFVGSSVPPYAILSHTWGNEEVSLYEVRENRTKIHSKAGYKKIQRCCEKALADGHEFIWVDSCCIDKQSSAELSEAINSMYKWYQNSSVCYAYLSDVQLSTSPSGLVPESFPRSRWFTRGWTLQELIAPRSVEFFAQDWSPLGTRHDLSQQLEDITGVNHEVFHDARETSLGALARTCVAEKMLWASSRQTTREEDMAYCLMGLFGAHMPVIYGEGLTSAFRRLQLEIIKISPDQSIFAWSAPRSNSGLLAESPADFAQSVSVIQGTEMSHWWATLVPFSMTNFGISINLPLYKSPDHKGMGIRLARIGARRHASDPQSVLPIMIYLKETVRVITGVETKSFYRRIRCAEVVVGQKEKSMTMYGTKHAHSCEDLFVPQDELYQAFIDSRQKWFDSHHESLI